MTNTIKVKLPLALQQLILRSNELLQNYRDELMSDINTSAEQLMKILNLNEADGWVLDMENMVFTRPEPADELTSENEQ